MKKIFSLLILLMLFIPSNINAGNATISVRANRTTLILGNSVAVTVTVSADTNIGAWEFDLKYDTSKLRFVSSTAAGGGTSVADTYTQTGQKTKSYTFNFKTIARGDANLWISGAQVIEVNETVHTTKTTSQTLKIMTQAELESTYSKNNYLKSLEVTDFELNPEFKKDVLIYTVTLPPETKEATIKGAVEDSKSKVTGFGVKELVDGDNEFLIVVEAQNGSERTYTLNLVVAELDPIVVKIGTDDFTVIRKTDQVTCPTLFEAKTITYNSEEVPSCYNETIDFNLIAMKNPSGESELFIFNNDTFTLYKEVIVNRMIIYPSDIKTTFKMPENALKKTITISNTDVVAYQLNDNKDFYLLTGKNVETGDENIYLYDSKEMTMQRYIPNESNEDKYFIIIIVLAILSSVLLVTTLTTYYKIHKRKKKLNKVIDKKLEPKT